MQCVSCKVNGNNHGNTSVITEHIKSAPTLFFVCERHAVSRLWNGCHAHIESIATQSTYSDYKPIASVEALVGDAPCTSTLYESPHTLIVPTADQTLSLFEHLVLELSSATSTFSRIWRFELKTV